jgi:hypothetical protein
MIIAIDIGNSNVVIGVHDGEFWRHTWRLPTLIEETMLFYEMRLADHLLEAGISPDVVKQGGAEQRGAAADWVSLWNYPKSYFTERP